MNADLENHRPYVGPRPFERGPEDSQRFFGRELETREIVALVLSHPVLLVYAQSGAGKTSLFNARIAPALEDNWFEVLPVTRVSGAIPDGVDIARVRNVYVFNALLNLNRDADPNALLTTSLHSYLEQRPRAKNPYGSPVPRAVIFDQMEEIFTVYHPDTWLEHQQDFFSQITEALNADPLLRAVLIIREDYLASFEPFARFLPDGLRTRFRLERLGEHAALEAVTKPLQSTDRQFAEGVAERLVQDLLKIRAVTNTGETIETKGEFAEPVQLQVVCDSLWQELPADVTAITGEYLQAYGDVDQALSEFYERTIRRVAQETRIDEEDLRNLFERTLITPAGTRGTVFKGLKTTGAAGKSAGLNPLKRILPGKNGAVSNTAMEMLVDTHLIRAESRAGAQWYELTHDRFIEPIKKSNQEYVQRRRKRTVIAAGTVLPLFMVATLAWLVFEVVEPPQILERIVERTVEVQVEVREVEHAPIRGSGGRFQRSVPIDALRISTGVRGLTVNYGDGSSEVKAISSQSSSLELDHVYQKVGQFTVSISTPEGELLRILVPVDNVPPSVEMRPVNRVTEGTAISALVSFTDSGQGPWNATVGFGDGPVSSPLEISESNQPFMLVHTYSDNGTYEIAVTVEDEFGDGDSGTTLVEVLNVAPQVNVEVEARITEGERYVSQGSFIDPGQDSWKVTVDYGDGSPVESLGFDAASKTFSLDHVYEYEGVYTITVTVDDGEQEVGKNTATVEVEKDLASNIDAHDSDQMNPLTRGIIPSSRLRTLLT